MLWYYVKEICYSSIFVMVLCFLSAGYAYLVNARRTAGDPDKKEFEFNAVWLAPLTWPLLLPLAIVVTVLRAVVGIVLVSLFALGVLAIRKPFIISWLEKITLKIGNKLLHANSVLIRAILGKSLDASK